MTKARIITPGIFNGGSWTVVEEIPVGKRRTKHLREFVVICPEGVRHNRYLTGLDKNPDAYCRECRLAKRIAGRKHKIDSIFTKGVYGTWQVLSGPRYGVWRSMYFKCKCVGCGELREIKSTNLTNLQTRCSKCSPRIENKRSYRYKPVVPQDIECRIRAAIKSVRLENRNSELSKVSKGEDEEDGE